VVVGWASTPPRGGGVAGGGGVPATSPIWRDCCRGGFSNLPYMAGLLSGGLQQPPLQVGVAVGGSSTSCLLEQHVLSYTFIWIIFRVIACGISRQVPTSQRS
jgi:hypothetical protein